MAMKMHLRCRSGCILGEAMKQTIKEVLFDVINKAGMYFIG